MIPFKELQPEDKETIQRIVCSSGCHGIDYNFANLFIWRKTYKPLVYFTNERMFLIMPEFNDMYAFPKGSGPLTPAINAMLDDAHARGHKLMMRGLTDSSLIELTNIYGDRFEITEDRDNAEYIYTKQKLCNLPGRHLASKRNHIHKFERNGQWHFDEINQNNMQDAILFMNKFYTQINNPELEAEAMAVDEMFNNFDILGFTGALLYQNDRIVAFTAGTRLDDITFDVNFEKCLPDCEGGYTMVNREFARLISQKIPEIEIFNREEDMGIPGLRKAKESYKPDILLMKYYAKEK